MGRKYGTWEDTVKVRKWIRSALEALRIHLHMEGIYLASANDVYHLIESGKLSPPPKISHTAANRGQVLCVLFRNQEFYRNTGKYVKAEMPSNKQRKISVWEYIPEHDNNALKDEEWMVE